MGDILDIDEETQDATKETPVTAQEIDKVKRRTLSNIRRMQRNLVNLKTGSFEYLDSIENITNWLIGTGLIVIVFVSGNYDKFRLTDRIEVGRYLNPVLALGILFLMLSTVGLISLKLMNFGIITISRQNIRKVETLKKQLEIIKEYYGNLNDLDTTDFLEETEEIFLELEKYSKAIDDVIESESSTIPEIRNMFRCIRFFVICFLFGTVLLFASIAIPLFDPIILYFKG